MKYKNLALIMGFTGSILLAGQAQASFLIDDFNFTEGSFVEDRTADNSGVEGGRGIGGYVASGWSRDKIYANLVEGDRVEEADCANCQEGHFINDSNTIGNGYESWKKDSGVQDFSNTTWAIDYGLDVEGLDVVLSLFDSTTGIIKQIWWSDIDAVGLPGAPGTLSGMFGADVFADYIFIDELSVGGIFDPSAAANYASVLTEGDFGKAAYGADFNKDNVRVSAPASLAMLFIGLLGLGANRLRKQ